MKAIATIAVAVSLALSAAAARAEMVRSPDGKVVWFTQQGTPAIDHANLKPVPMPLSRKALPSQAEMEAAAANTRPAGPLVIVPGGRGNGKMHPVTLGPPNVTPKAGTVKPPPGGGGVHPLEYGGSGQVYTTSDVPYDGDAPYALPYRMSGRVDFNQGFCSGSLIKRGVVLTAAHCIWDWYNKSAYGGWTYTPAYRGSSAPYGVWNTVTGYITDDYLAGRCATGQANCDCNTSGVQCTDDVGLLLLVPDKDGKYAGDYTGWFGYAINSFSYTSGMAQITQLGYPSGLDGGELLVRNDSRGVINTTVYGNTIIGSLMNPGSSGGPWVVNFGPPPTVASNVVQGAASTPNLVVGVSSWFNGNRQNGASPFLDSNIKALVSWVCAAKPEACADQ